MSITADRTVNRLIKNLLSRNRQHYSKAEFVAYLDAAAFVLIKLQKERHSAKHLPQQGRE